MVNMFEYKVFRKIKSSKLAHSLSVIISVIVIILLISLLLVALIPQIVDSFVVLGSNVNIYASALQDFFKMLSDIPLLQDVDFSVFMNLSGEMVSRITEFLTDNYKSILSTSYNVGIGIFNLLIGFILAIYFLLDKRRMIEGLKRLFRALFVDSAYEKVMGFIKKCDDIMISFIVFDILDACIVGIVNSIFMLIAGYPYAVLISVIVGITNMLPTFGPIIGAVVGALILLLINPIYALVFLIFTIILQIIDGYILKPRLFGATLGVPAVLILIAIIIGGNMFGAIGILLAIPCAAILMVVYDDILDFISRIRHTKKTSNED